MFLGTIFEPKACAHLDLNQGPTDYETAALTTELWARSNGKRLAIAGLSVKKPEHDMLYTLGLFPATRDRGLEGWLHELLRIPEPAAPKRDLSAVILDKSACLPFAHKSGNGINID